MNAEELQHVLTLDEFEQLARGTMSSMAYEYVASGAADEHSLRWNHSAYAEIRLRPRVLVDVGTLDTAITLFGCRIPHPVLLAPAATTRRPRGRWQARWEKGIKIGSSASG